MFQTHPKKDNFECSQKSVQGYGASRKTPLTQWRYIPYKRHYNPLLIRNHSWILTIHKDRIFWKKLLEKMFLASNKWVKNIQTSGYNGARTVYKWINKGAIFFDTNYLELLMALGSCQKFWLSKSIFCI